MKNRLTRAFRRCEHMAMDLRSMLAGTRHGNIVRAFWYRRVRNFGDLITPALFRHYGVTPVHSPPARAKIVSTGSILQSVPTNYSGTVLGSGLIMDEQRLLPHARVLGVRGSLTRERIGAPPGAVLGDPGLLASRLLLHRPTVEFTLGIVPHYKDWRDSKVQHFTGRYRQDVLVIDVRRHPADVIRDIGRCRHIVSSSLHGIIVADALGVPNAWTPLSTRVIGGGFKFRDYATALGRGMVPVSFDGTERLSQLVEATRPPPSTISEVQEQLDQLFRSVASEVTNREECDSVAL